MRSKTGRWKRASSRPARGFTLLEVSISIVLIGVAGALVAPFAGGMIDGANGIVTEFERLCHRAQARAATSGEPVEVELVLPTGVYTMTSRSVGEGSARTLEEGRLEEIGILELRDEPGEVALLVFSPRGEVVAPELWVRDERGVRRAVTLNRWTGRVRLDAR